MFKDFMERKNLPVADNEYISNYGSDVTRISQTRGRSRLTALLAYPEWRMGVQEAKARGWTVSPPYTWKEIMDVMAKSMDRRAISIWLPFHLLYLVGAISMAVGWLLRRRPFLHLRNVAYLRHRYWRIDTLKAERNFGYITPATAWRMPLTLTARWYADQGLL